MTNVGQSNLLRVPLIVLEVSGQFVGEVRNDDMFVELGPAGGRYHDQVDALSNEELEVHIVKADYFSGEGAWKVE